jgi:hypothetical protein
VQAGFHLQQLVEAPAPLAICDELWPEDSPLAPLRAMPHTAIMVGEVPGQAQGTPPTSVSTFSNSFFK